MNAGSLRSLLANWEPDVQLGLLADIHEDAGRLEAALAHFSRQGVEQVVLLGDVAETGQHLEPVVKRLEEAGAIGVWGNHDLGFCHEPDPELLARYPTVVTGFLARLQPRWEMDRYLLTHALPTVDPTDPVAYYLSLRPHELEGRLDCFARFPGRVLLMGHYHRWLAATSEHVLSWEGNGPLDLASHPSMLVVLHAVMEGWCSVLDTNCGVLHPQFVG